MKKKKILTEVFVLFFIAAIFMSVYVIIEMGNDWLAVLGGAVVLLIASYLLLDYRLETNEDGSEEADSENDKLNQRLDELEEVQKAIYTVIKRGNSENAELFRGLEKSIVEMTQGLERFCDAALSQNAEETEAKQELLQTGKHVLDAVKGMRQDYQIGVKNLIKYEKENAKQIAENAHNNTEMTIMEITSLLAKVQESLEDQKEQLAFLRMTSGTGSVPYEATTNEEGETEFNAEEMLNLIDNSDFLQEVPEELEFTLPMDDGMILPVLDDAATPAVESTMQDSSGDADSFDAEAAIKAYMIEQGYVDAENSDEDTEDTEEENAEEESESSEEESSDGDAEPEQVPAQKSEEEIANTLQNMASGDPNRALTPEEIAAMFAAIQ